MELWINTNRAKLNRERIDDLREQEAKGELSIHDDVRAIVELVKRQNAENPIVKKHICPRCRGRILGDSCINCGYSID
jgi:hypothetical protein